MRIDYDKRLFSNYHQGRVHDGSVIRLRTYSVIELSSEKEFDEGMRDLDLAAQSEKTPEPVMAKLELLVFERRRR